MKIDKKRGRNGKEGIKTGGKHVKLGNTISLFRIAFSYQ